MACEIPVEDVEYVRHGDTPLLARLFKPRGPGPFPLIVEVHGGAWCRKDGLDATPINEPLAKSGVVVAALDFRMPPVAPYPASMVDINYAIRWLKTRAAELGARPDRIGLMGTSSGAHQAMLAAMRPRDSRYAAIPLPAGAAAVDASVSCAVLCWPVIDPLARYRYAKKLREGGKPYPDVIDRVLPDHDQYWQSEEAMAEGAHHADAGAAARDRAAGAESADGQARRGRRLFGWVSRRRRHRLPEGLARGQSQPDRDVPDGPRHPRRLVPPAHPRRRLRLRRSDAHAPHHRHERGGRLRSDRDRGPARPQAGPSSHRDRAHDPPGADGGQGQGGRGGPPRSGLSHHCPHQRDAGQHDRRCVAPRRSLPKGRGRRLAALDGAHARTAPRHRRAAGRAADVSHVTRRTRRPGHDAAGARSPGLPDRRRPADAVAGGVCGLEEGVPGPR